MPTLEWDIPFTVVTPYAPQFGSNLLLNQDLGGGRSFKVNPKNSVTRRGIRATADPIPQGDGEIFHERFSEGYQMQFAVQLWQGAEAIACDVALCEMRDELFGHLWSLLRPSDDGGRVLWDPSCGDGRMLDAVRLLSVQDPGEGEQGAIEITFIVDSPFPYGISQAQTTVVLTGTDDVPNDGNVDFWPVIQVNTGVGSCGAFTIERDDGLLIEWDAAYGGNAFGNGDYAEIDTFKSTIFLNGDEDDLSSSIVALTTDYFPIQPGGNSVNAIGAGAFTDATFLVNDAYA